MNVLVLASQLWDTSPGSRFRIEQWIKYMSRDGTEFNYVSFDDPRLNEIIYLKGHYLGKAIHVVLGFLRRLWLLPRVRKYDLVFIYQEASRIGPAVVEHLIHALGVPIVYDFCDPIYLPQESDTNKWFNHLKFCGKTATICKLSELVLVGNRDLADYALRFNPNVTIVPITIDTREYAQRQNTSGRIPVIGWSGSHSTVKHLDGVREMLSELRASHEFTLSILGTPKYEILGLEVDAASWSPNREIPFFHSCDIGIMPLPDDPWVKLRSHLKVRQFMGVGMPCVASPVGIITELIEDGINGFLASTKQEWLQKLGRLIEDSDLRLRMGKQARKTIEERYSGELWAGKLLEILKSAARNGNRGRQLILNKVK